MKKLLWMGTSLNDLRAFPDDVRRRSGYQLRRVQSGLEPTDWKPMPDIGPGVMEIRIHEAGEYRVFYVAKFKEAVYVLHAFRKKTQKTAKADIESGKRRYADVLKEHEE